MTELAFGPRTRTRGTAYSDFGYISFEKMEDVVVENFKQRRDAGELINNPMTYISYRRTGREYWNHSCRTRYYYVSSGGQFNTDWTSAPLPCTMGAQYFSAEQIASMVKTLIASHGGEAFSQNEKNLLKTSILADIGSGASQAYVTFAESKKTLRMLARAAHFLRRPISDAMKLLRVTRKAMSDADTRAKVLDKASELWLEYRYGWRPLVFDAIASFEAYSLGGRPIRFTKRGTIKRPDIQSVDDVSVLANSQLGVIGTKSTIIISSSLRAGATVDYAFDTSDSLSFMFGATDLLGSAWEMVKFSFVVDWFINVGNVLQGLQALVLTNQRVGWFTETHRVTVVHQPYVSGPYDSVADGIRYTWDFPTSWRYSAPYTEFYTVKIREPWDSFLPMFGVQFNVDTAKTIDAIALLKTVLHIR